MNAKNNANQVIAIFWKAMVIANKFVWIPHLVQLLSRLSSTFIHVKGVVHQEINVNRKYVYLFNWFLSALKIVVYLLKEMFKNVPHVHHFLNAFNAFIRMEFHLVSLRVFPIVIGFLQLKMFNARKIHLVTSAAAVKR